MKRLIMLLILVFISVPSVVLADNVEKESAVEVGERYFQAIKDKDVSKLLELVDDQRFSEEDIEIEYNNFLITEPELIEYSVQASNEEDLIFVHGEYENSEKFNVELRIIDGKIYIPQEENEIAYEKSFQTQNNFSIQSSTNTLVTHEFDERKRPRQVINIPYSEMPNGYTGIQLQTNIRTTAATDVSTFSAHVQRRTWYGFTNLFTYRLPLDGSSTRYNAYSLDMNPGSYYRFQLQFPDNSSGSTYRVAGSQQWINY